ncbi:uncharacterized protein AFUA_8G05900 [Aspergillus fumigatus Af293]|uniref:Uncharacterized protein n=2 Tax=Aspergillus fumigatus TaxID=746128 RepID=Q4WC30_ASPFU|nr:hypothetical protein AFUA_8G05900 [Aspergillus fumigatus Af293]EAL85354.1 hypothetical protein AFUA_8G05900 [Aspergillus fumigatus Af293]EDP48722.1 hypothetical protein AFUB_081640 [Aspergillus fumigatus A1163]
MKQGDGRRLLAQAIGYIERGMGQQGGGELPEHQVCVRPSGRRYKRTTAAPQGPAWGTSSSDAKTDRQS